MLKIFSRSDTGFIRWEILYNAANLESCEQGCKPIQQILYDARSKSQGYHKVFSTSFNLI